MRHFLLPLFLVALDIISAIAAALCSVYLRFENLNTVANQGYVSAVVAQLPWLILLTLVFTMLFQLYSRIWRYAGLHELLAVVGAVVCTTGCWYAGDLCFGVLLPRSLYIITGILLLLFIGGSRIFLRLYNYFYYQPARAAEEAANKQVQHVLIVGAGDAGAVIGRELEQYKGDGLKAVGFIDDDPKKLGKRMLGLKVLGNRYAIKETVITLHVDEIFIAMPAASKKSIKELTEICLRTKCKVKVLPGVYELLNGTVSISKLRNVEIEDLLGRESVHLDEEKIGAYLKDKLVLITGAGGSIGSEICRQVARMQPKKMLLLGKGENSIYEITNDLKDKFPNLRTVPIIADVRDQERIKGIMDYFHPQVVFHAAAHKHVPLMEYQPMEAVRNNVLGTKVVAEEAAAHNVETFVMISTDKAVNPTSVMGCTKRVAEMYVQSMNGTCATRFVAVRFGNVLGSRGSVIPLFKKQIARGGPVTVTHPDMKRYFMTIPEASQLVLQAGAMAEGGEVFVLDMGEPVKICDLAKNLITLSGLEPGKDILIKYTGLRPGEKLFEELLSAEDGTDATGHAKIFVARIKKIAKAEMDANVTYLLEQTNEDDVVAALQKVVPTYHPNRVKD